MGAHKRRWKALERGEKVNANIVPKRRFSLLGLGRDGPERTGHLELWMKRGDGL